MDDNIYEEVSDNISGAELKISPADVQVSVNCSIGTLKLSLDELMCLRIGDVLDIKSTHPLVSLTMNGLCFAQGYLIELNGMLGVKITKKMY